MVIEVDLEVLNQTKSSRLKTDEDELAFLPILASLRLNAWDRLVNADSEAVDFERGSILKHPGAGFRESWRSVVLWGTLD